MRKLLTILLILVLCCSLVSCGGESSKSEKQGISFEVRMYSGAVVDAEYDKRLFFSSREELDAYYKEHSVQFGGVEFEAFCEKYDEAYFEKQVLVGVLNSTGPNVDRSVHSLKFRDGKYILTIKSITNLDEGFVEELYPPYYFFIEPETGHKITASNFEVEWIKETVE